LPLVTCAACGQQTNQDADAVGFQCANCPSSVPAAPVMPAIDAPLPGAHPPAAPRAVLTLSEALSSRNVTLLRLRAKVAARERDHLGGHILARHSPDLSDDILRRRLTEGIDKEGDLAVTKGVSSKFESKEAYSESLMAVIEHLHQRLLRTMEYLRENIPADRQRAYFITGNTGGAAVPGLTPDMRTAVNLTQDSATMLPVYWDEINKRIQFYKKYEVLMRHKKRIGVGFYGTKPTQAVVQGQVIKVFGGVQEFRGQGEHTFSLLGPSTDAKRAVGGGEPISDWKWVTHYPTDPTDGDGKPKHIDAPEVRGRN